MNDPSGDSRARNDSSTSKTSSAGNGNGTGDAQVADGSVLNEDNSGSSAPGNPTPASGAGPFVSERRRSHIPLTDDSAPNAANSPDPQQDADAPDAFFEADDHETSGTEVTHDVTLRDASSGSSSNVGTPVPAGVEDSISERQKSKMPSANNVAQNDVNAGSSSIVVEIPTSGAAPNKGSGLSEREGSISHQSSDDDGACSPPTQEHLNHAIANARVNAKIGKGHQTGDFKSRRESLTEQIKQAARKLVHMRRNSRDVSFEQEVKVKELEDSDSAPMDLPRSPVFERDLRKKGEVPNKAEREAAKVEKAKRRCSDDFERRLANGSHSSSSAPSLGDRIIGVSNQLAAKVQAVDEFAVRRSSRERMPSNSRSSPSPQAGQSPETQISGGGSMNTPDTTRGAEYTSDSPNHLPIRTCGTPGESMSQANSVPSTQAGQASHNSISNQENLSPDSRAAAEPGLSSSHPDNQSTKKEEAGNAKEYGEHPAPDPTVNAQFAVVYDRDPFIAIQSLEPNFGFANKFSTNFHTAPSTYQLGMCAEFPTEIRAARIVPHGTVSRARSPQREKVCNASNEDDRASSQRGYNSLLAYCLDSLDELGSQLWPVSDHSESFSETQSSEESLILDDCNDVLSLDDDGDLSPIVQKETTDDLTPRQPPPHATKASKKLSEAVRLGADVCHLQSTLSCPVLPATEISHTLPNSEPALGARTCRSVQENSPRPSTGTENISERQPTLGRLDLDVVAPKRPPVRGEELFGKTLEEAYNAYCMTQCHSERGELPASTLRPPMTESMERPTSNVSSTTAALEKKNESQCESMTRPPLLESRLYPLAYSGRAVSESSNAERTCEPRSSSSSSKASCGVQSFYTRASREPHIFPRVEGAVNDLVLSTEEVYSGMLHELSVEEEDGTPGPLAAMLSEPDSTPASPQYTPTRAGPVSSDFGRCNLSAVVSLDTHPAEGILGISASFNSPRHAKNRSNSSSTGLSERSVKTAVIESQNSVPCKASSDLAGLGNSIKETLCNEVGDTDRTKFDNGCSLCGSELRAPIFSEGSHSLIRQRHSSGISSASTFFSQSEASETSKTSIDSGSSSGSSCGSALPFGFDGTSQRWRPRTSKSQASLGITQEPKGRTVEPSTGVAPAPRPVWSSPSSEAMRKFVMKSPVARPERAERSTTKMEIRSVVRKRSSLRNLLGTWRGAEEVAPACTLPDASSLQEEIPEQPWGIDRESARHLAFDNADDETLRPGTPPAEVD